jgi:transposase
MAFKRITPMNIYEIIRRWHCGQSIRKISKVLEYDRKTVRKFVDIAKSKGLSPEQALPPKQDVIALLESALPKTQRPAAARDVLVPYLPEIKKLINQPQNPLKPKSAFEVICTKYDLSDKVSYSSFKRFVRINEVVITPQKTTCRIEVAPGLEVQIDYAKMGLLYDPASGKRRTVYAFIATLSHSRHKFVEFVWSQNQQSFVSSHVLMFEFFGGVPERIVLDNLKSGVIKPDLYEPTLNRTYREMAEHYNCFLDPCRVARPKDKGKVERDVQTVREQFRQFPALYPDLDIDRANRLIRKWLVDEYGQRTHGTTRQKPFQVFREIEQAQLKPLPTEPFQIAQWKQASVHPDHYIQFNKKSFSVPHAYVGKKVWVRATGKLVQIYFEDKLIKQHAITAGYRHTDFNDFPENIKAALDHGLPRHIQNQAEAVGPNFFQLVRQTLEPHAFINLRRAQGLVGLIPKWKPYQIEQAAAYALKNQISVTPKNFQRLLEKFEQKTQATENIAVSQETMEFIRDADYFLGPAIQ